MKDGAGAPSAYTSAVQPTTYRTTQSAAARLIHGSLPAARKLVLSGRLALRYSGGGRKGLCGDLSPNAQPVKAALVLVAPRTRPSLEVYMPAAAQAGLGRSLGLDLGSACWP